MKNLNNQIKLFNCAIQSYLTLFIKSNGRYTVELNIKCKSAVYSVYYNKLKS